MHRTHRQINLAHEFADNVPVPHRNHAGNRPPRPAEQTTSKLLPKPQHSGSITGLTTSAHLASLLAARLNKMVAAETLAVPTLVNLQLLFSQRFFASTNVNDLIPREEDRTFITVHTVTPTKENHRFIAAQFLNSSSLIKMYCICVDVGFGIKRCVQLVVQKGKRARYMFASLFIPFLHVLVLVTFDRTNVK